MDSGELRALFRAVASGVVTPEAAEEKMVEDTIHLPFARFDRQRSLRRGFPEVIYAEGKTEDQLVALMGRLIAEGEAVFATRVSKAQAERVRESFPEVVHHPKARILHRASQARAQVGRVGVLCAGTADLPVAEEAAVTAEIMGARVDRVWDVGVAGLHRLADEATVLRASQVLVVVAGLEGALASVVTGLCSCPVIGVPTSVGYGASFGGLSALLGMLNACASGLTVVNIDNGFGAGYAAALINGGATRGVGDE